MGDDFCHAWAMQALDAPDKVKQKFNASRAQHLKSTRFSLESNAFSTFPKALSSIINITKSSFLSHAVFHGARMVLYGALPIPPLS